MVNRANTNPNEPQRQRPEETSVDSIHLADVSLRRGTNWILRNISWSVPQGACAAILGPNGSGKSTLARIVAGHWWPTEGESRVLGSTFGEADMIELRRSIRLVQPAGPYDIDPELTARQVVLTGFFGTIGLYDTPTEQMEQEASAVLQHIGLSGVGDHVYTTLSSGERMRALIGRALVREPRLLLLDEPTAGLDLLAREQVLATVEALFHREASPPTTIFITHHLEELPPATSHILLLANGAAVSAGPPRHVLTEANLSKAYGCPVQLRYSNGRYYAEVHPDSWRGLLGQG